MRRIVPDSCGKVQQNHGLLPVLNRSIPEFLLPESPVYQDNYALRLSFYDVTPDLNGQRYDVSPDNGISCGYRHHHLCYLQW